jgi:hypothetical protein
LSIRAHPVFAIRVFLISASGNTPPQNVYCGFSRIKAVQNNKAGHVKEVFPKILPESSFIV